MWGCKVHWFRLPHDLRNRIWATYRPGQEITKTPSVAYLDAAKAVQKWIGEQESAADKKAAADLARTKTRSTP